MPMSVSSLSSTSICSWRRSAVPTTPKPRLKPAIVAWCAPSPAAKRKPARHGTDAGTPPTFFRDLGRPLATLTRHSATTAHNPNDSFSVTATPTDLQSSAFELLGVKPTFAHQRLGGRQESPLPINTIRSHNEQSSG